MRGSCWFDWSRAIEMGGSEGLLRIWEVYAEVDAVKWGPDDRRY